MLVHKLCLSVKQGTIKSNVLKTNIKEQIFLASHEYAAIVAQLKVHQIFTETQ